MNKGLSVLLTGDFCPADKFIHLSRDYFAVLNDRFKGIDFFVTNLEAPLTSNDKVKGIRKIGPHLKASEQAIQILNNAGINVTCLANNHIMDFGLEGLRSTIETCRRNNISTVGAGLTKKETDNPLILDKNGLKLVILNYAENEFSTVNWDSGGANRFDLVKICQDIQQYRTKNNIVLVILHGGIEGYNLPSPEIVKRLRFIASFQPSAIVCHHTHTISGFEEINNTPIYYSLGNFYFEPLQPKNTSWTNGLLIQLNFDETGRLLNHLQYPFYQNPVQNSFYFLEDAEREGMLDNIVKLNEIINNQALLEAEFENYTDNTGEGRLSFILNPNKFFRRLFRIGIFKRVVLSMHSLTSIYGVISCESHLEILLSYLRKRVR